jgi:hypothetical protein
MSLFRVVLSATLKFKALPLGYSCPDRTDVSITLTIKQRTEYLLLKIRLVNTETSFLFGHEQSFNFPMKKSETLSAIKTKNTGQFFHKFLCVEKFLTVKTRNR